MDRKSLTIFTKLYECGSMHKAAEQLFVSQQSISKTILALEDELNAPLFLRTSRGVVPTAVGNYLYKEALSIRDQYERIYHNAAAFSANECIRIACAYGTLYQLFPLFKQFEKEHPGASINWCEMTDRETEQALLSEKVDIAVNIRGGSVSYVQFTPLYTRKICMLVYEGHQLYQNSGITARDLDGERVIIEGPDFRIYQHFLQYCAAAESHPQIIAETAEIGFCQHMAELREGLAVTVDFIAERSILKSTRMIPLVSPPLLWEVGLTQLRGKKSRGLEKELASFLQQHTDFQKQR
ncbi:MAG: LysR family transcriptional regulator [Lachnospiraceae bacterium]|nr:LysR family transcriptional regulator [Lachnospiraceae bacterium]